LATKNWRYNINPKKYVGVISTKKRINIDKKPLINPPSDWGRSSEIESFSSSPITSNHCFAFSGVSHKIGLASFDYFFGRGGFSPFSIIMRSWNWSC